MNWLSEATHSWSNLHWVREVCAEDVEPISALPQLIRGMGQWNESLARDRHATGNPDRIFPNEYFVYAAALMSRAAKQEIEGALNIAIAAGVDHPMAWPDMDLDEAKAHWQDAYQVITNVGKAWITLWNDLAALQDQMTATSQQELLEQWQTLANQAVETIEGLAEAFWAQTRR